jgi:hypothetical protein
LAVQIQTFSQTRRPNFRAWLAFFFGLVAAVTIPVAIELTRKVPGAVLLDAVWSIPVTALSATSSLLFARGAHGAISLTLERRGGAGLIRLARVLAIVGVCVTLSASIAVGLYELLLRLEH